MVLEFFQVLLALPEDLGVHALCRSYSGSIGFIEEESPLESSNVLPMSPIGLRSFPTGPGPAKSCEKKEWGFSYPHSHGGTESPPSYSRNSGPAGAQRRQPRRRGGQECPPSQGAPCFSQELPHRPRSGEILREKEWGFSYPHSSGGQESPPSCPSPVSRIRFDRIGVRAALGQRKKPEFRLF